MRRLASVALALVLSLAAQPSAACTYFVDLILNDSVVDDTGSPYDTGTSTPGGTVFDPLNPVLPDVHLTGTIETDVTLGALSS